MNGKYVIRELEPGRWILDFVTNVGTVSGYTTYASAEVAAEIAKARDPNADIEIRPFQR